jgi:hypothetical protein
MLHDLYALLSLGDQRFFRRFRPQNEDVTGLAGLLPVIPSSA